MYKSITASILSVCLLLCLKTSAGNYDSLLTLTGTSRFNYLYDLYGNAFNTGAIKYGELKNFLLAKGNTDDRLYYDFRDKEDQFKRKPHNFNELINFYLEWANKARDNRVLFLLQGIYYLMGQGYWVNNQPEKALEYYLYCYDELKNDPEKKYFRRSDFLYVMAFAFYRYQEYDRAIEMAKISEGINYSYDNNFWDRVSIVSTNLIGAAYLKSKQYDSALVWFQKSILLAKATKFNDDINTLWQGISLGYIASTYYAQGNVTMAIPLYEQGITICRSTGTWDNLAPFCSDLANIFMANGTMERVSALLEEAKLADEKDSRIENKYKYYSALTTYYRKTGNATLALQAQDSALWYQTKLNSESDITKSISAVASFSYQKKSLENKVALQKIEKEKWLRYGLIGVIFMLLAIGFLFFKQLSLRHKLKQANLEKEKMEVEEDLKSLGLELNEYINKLLKEKNEIKEKYNREIEQLKQTGGNDTAGQLAVLENLKTATVLTEADWTNFQKVFEQAHPGYLARLKTAYTDLTPAEIRFLLFSKMELSPKEMFTILGVGSEAIRQIRFRIKKKLSLNDAKEIEELAKAI